jgi:competence protein ComEA
LAIAAIGLIVSGGARGAPGSAPTTTFAAIPHDSATQRLVVDVAGAVRRPGVYELSVGSRVAQALRRAGGISDDADVGTLNRAAELVDGQHIVVPTRGAHASPSSLQATSASISINAADATQLDALPGIGPVTAARIVEDRAANGPFGSIDDLDRVPGIGSATIEELRAAATL